MPKAWNRGLTKIDPADAARMHRAGATPQEIADHHGVCLATVYNTLHRAGIHRANESARGEGNSQWNNGTYRANRKIAQNYWIEAKMVAAICLGRLLLLDEVIHHHDENPANNDPANLWIFPGRSAHSRYHCALRGHRRAGGTEASIPRESAFGGLRLPQPLNPIVF